MVIRSSWRRRISASLAVAALTLASACSGSDAPEATSESHSGAGVTSTPTDDAAEATEPSSTPTPTMAQPDPGATPPGPRGVEMVLPPTGVDVTGPIVVLVHGGGWVAGEPSYMDGWAKALAATGAVVFNASYRLPTSIAKIDLAAEVDDVACAVRYARWKAAAETTSTELVIMGHSAGGHLAAVVALDGNGFGADCGYPEAPLPDKLVGLAGVYDLREAGSLFSFAVGGQHNGHDLLLAEVDPVELADKRSDLDVILVTGANDPTVPPEQAADFAAVLPPNEVVIHDVPGLDHLQLQDPALVGLTAVGF